MKLAFATIYIDNDLTIPITPLSVIVATRGERSMFVRKTNPPGVKGNSQWVRENDNFYYHPADLQDIIIIYRSPEKGVGPELIEPLHNLGEQYVEKIISGVESFLTKVSDKIVNSIRAVLEEE